MREHWGRASSAQTPRKYHSGNSRNKELIVKWMTIGLEK